MMQRGDAFVLDLKVLDRTIHSKLHGKFAVVWSLGAITHPNTKTRHARLAMADALFDKPPTLGDLRRRKLNVLVLTHRSPPVSAMYFVEDGPLPRGVTAIGKLTALPKAKPYRCYGYWSSFALSWHHQWRHDHDQKALAAETKRIEEKREKELAEAQKRRRAGGLAGVGRRTLVPEWTGLVGAARCRAVREILRTSIRQLASTKPAGRRKVLEDLVDRINAYNDAQGSFIETPEREALMACLEDVAVVSGLGPMTKKLDAWRDW